MLITVFVFLGIEGASVYSRYRQADAKTSAAPPSSASSACSRLRAGDDGVLRRHAAGRARRRRASRRWRRCWSPSSGHWGSVFISVGVIVSVLGAYLAWTLMAAEVLYIPAKNDDMPRFLAPDQQPRTRRSRADDGRRAVQLLLVLTAVRRGRIRFHARSDGGAVADPVPARGGYAVKLTCHPRTYEDGESTGAGPGRRRRWPPSTPCSCSSPPARSSCCRVILYAPADALYVNGAARAGPSGVLAPPRRCLFAVILAAARSRGRRGPGHRAAIDNLNGPRPEEALTMTTHPSATYGVHSEVGKLRKVLVCSPGPRAPAGSPRPTATTCSSTT